MSRSEKVSSVVLIIFGLFVAYYAHTYLKLGILIRPGAGFIPFYIGIALVILGIFWFFSTLITPKLSVKKEPGCAGVPAADGSRRNLIISRLLPAILLVFFYAWFFEKIGYLISTFFFIIGWQKVVERERWLKTIISAVLCAAAMYGLFAYLLKIALPIGSWFS
jgi:putative tricarboxylic transport membrane protein